MKKTIISILCACISASCFAARQIVMFPDAAAMETAITDFKAGGVDVIRTIPLINALLIGENDGVFLSRVITFDGQAPFTVEDEQIGSIAGEALAPRLALSEISAVENVPAVMGSSSQDTIPWGITRVNAPAVWERLTGNGVKVCVIDTGIDMTHSDLASNYAGGYDFVNEDDNPLDDNGHGTHVSGTIAAV
jgi:subtilisin family serine protease